MSKNNVIAFIASTLIIGMCLQSFHFIEEPTPIKIYMVLVPVVFVYNITNFGVVFRLSAAEKSSLIFFGFMLLSSAWAEEKLISVVKMFGIFFLILSYYVIRSTVDILPKLLILHTISLSGILILIVSLILYGVGIYYYDVANLALHFEGIDRGYYGLYMEGNMVRMRGSFDSPNNLSLMCVFLFFYYDYNKTRVSSIGKVLAILSLTLTLSMTGIVALIFGYLCGVFFKGKYFSIILVVMGFVSVFGAATILLPSNIIDNMVDSRLERVGTGSGRWELYEFTIQKIGSHPIIGYGLNQSRVILKEHRDMQSTHNSFLEATVDGGAVGFVLFMICWFFYLWSALKLSIRSKKPFYVSSAVSLLIFSNSNLLTFVEITILYFALWGVLSSRKFISY